MALDAAQLHPKEQTHTCIRIPLEAVLRAMHRGRCMPGAKAEPVATHASDTAMRFQLHSWRCAQLRTCRVCKRQHHEALCLLSSDMRVFPVQDCAIRAFALQLAQRHELGPTGISLKSMHEALQLGPRCGQHTQYIEPQQHQAARDKVPACPRTTLHFCMPYSR